MSLELHLKELGLGLALGSKPSSSYVAIKQQKSLLFLAGHSPKKDDSYPYLGKGDAELSLEQAQECARNCVWKGLASLKHYPGNLGTIKVASYISSLASFTGQAKVMDAASELFFEISGEAGRHARTAVGVAVLPGDSLRCS